MASKILEDYIQTIKDQRKKATFASSVLEEEIALSISKLESQGLPPLKHEDWKYTPIQNYLPASIKLNTSMADENSGSLDDDFYHIVVTGGRLNSKLLKLPRQGVNVTTFNSQSQAIDIPEGDELQAFCQTNNDHFNQLNLASFQEGLLIDIAHNQQLSKPLKITYSAASSYVAPRVFIKVGDFSQATIFENFESAAGECFENHVLKVLGGQGSSITYINSYTKGSGHTHIHSLTADIKKDATFNSVYLCSQNKLARNNLYINLCEENATARLNGLYACQDDNHSDHFITVNHQKGHTYSHQLYKGILNDSSRGVFTGKVIVHRDAQQVDSSQLNKNILLSPQAHVDTRPQLEVYADDVKCSHGATVGQLNQDELFYLESRGISPQRAFHLLCEGFAKEVFNLLDDRGKNKIVRQILNEQVNNILQGS